MQSLENLKNPLAEQKLIGTLLKISPDMKESERMRMIDPVLNKLSPEMFSDPLARQCFENIVQLRAIESPVDIELTVVSMDYESTRQVIGWTQTYADGDLNQLAQTIVLCHSKRTAINAIWSGSDLDSIVSSLTEATEEQFKLASNDLESHSIKSIFERNIGSFGDPSQTGLETGFECIDSQIGGLPYPGITILAGRTSEGKSLLSLNIADNVASRGKTVAYFSCEDGEKSTFERWETMSTGITRNDAQLEWLRCENGGISATLENATVQGAEASKDKPLYLFFEKSPTVATIRKLCKQLYKQRGCVDLVVVDYIQLLQPEGSKKAEMRYLEIGRMSRDLNILSGELNCPILVLAQRKRPENGEDKEKIPELSSLRESGDLEQDSESVIFIHRYDPDLDAVIDPVEQYRMLTIGKHKNCPRNTTFKIGCDFEKRKFFDIEE